MKQSNYILTIFTCIFMALLSTTMSLVKADNPIDVSIKLNVSFESQNYMKMAYTLDDNDEKSISRLLELPRTNKEFLYK